MNIRVAIPNSSVPQFAAPVASPELGGSFNAVDNFFGDIYLSCHPCSLGWVHIALSDGGVCQLSFADTADLEPARERLERTWPHANIICADGMGAELANTLFVNPLSGHKKNWPVMVKGTDFQLQVWRALLHIKAGQLCSYSDLATRVGKPTAVRAVASAVGANPVGFLIPCHRVIRSNGALGGFRWGLERKQALLDLEAAWQPLASV